MIRLSKGQVVLLHKRLIETTGGSNGIRDDGMLDSALANSFQSFGDEELYPSIQAAHHPFTAPKEEDIDKLFTDPAHVSSRAYDLVLNGYELSYTQTELSDIILDLASGKIGAEDILQWIISHQK